MQLVKALTKHTGKSSLTAGAICVEPWSLERVQQGAGVGADVIVFVDSLVQIYWLAVNADVHAAAVGGRHQCGHQRNI